MSESAQLALRREGIARGQRVCEIRIRHGDEDLTQESFSDEHIINGFPYWAHQDPESEKFYIVAFRDGVALALSNPPPSSLRSGDRGDAHFAPGGAPMRSVKTTGGYL